MAFIYKIIMINPDNDNYFYYMLTYNKNNFNKINLQTYVQNGLHEKSSKCEITHYVQNKILIYPSFERTYSKYNHPKLTYTLKNNITYFDVYNFKLQKICTFKGMYLHQSLIGDLVSSFERLEFQVYQTNFNINGSIKKKIQNTVYWNILRLF